MLNNITIGRYYNTPSKIHQMHPLSKMIITIVLIMLTFIANDIPLLLLTSALIMLLMGLSNIPIKIYLKNIISLKWILLFLVVINIISKVPLTNTIMIALRLILIIITTNVLTLTTTSTEITRGLEQLLSPLNKIGVPVHRLAFSISLAIRFIPNIIDQGNKILKSQASRGMDYYNANNKQKIQAIKSMIIPMFTLTLKKADIVSDTMEVRLYNINDKRTNYRMNQWHFIDTYLVTIHIFIFIFVVVSEVII